MKIIECPRDAMQGLSQFISTDDKVLYINKLLKVGFDTIDFGSFVSPKAIPQMRDTADVLAQLDWRNSKSKLLAIVANIKGAEDASTHEGVYYLGFPLSISETFQKRNTNKSIAEALSTLEEIQNICTSSNKTLVTYISMGFGNPYNDPYDVTLVAQFVDILATLRVKIISLADTIGVSTPKNIEYLFSTLSKRFSQIEFGAHLHSTPESAIEKIRSAFDAGCERFDGAMRGFGGCPMAKDDLVGNLATETLVAFFKSKNVRTSLDDEVFSSALREADRIFSFH
jgi:hydroxymethylglutaryl-CoA lyase